MARSQRRTDAAPFKVVRREGRKHLVVRFRDPATGLWRERSSQTTRRREADRIGRQIVEEILEQQASETTWAEARVRFERDRGPAMKKDSFVAWKSAINAFEKAVDPGYISSISVSVIQQFQNALRSLNRRPATIVSYTKHVQTMLRWAEETEVIDKAPTFRRPTPQLQKAMRGRPITGEEFERMSRRSRV